MLRGDLERVGSLAAQLASFFEMAMIQASISSAYVYLLILALNTLTPPII